MKVAHFFLKEAKLLLSKAICFSISMERMTNWVYTCTIGMVFRNLQLYSAVSRKVVGKSARDNPERYCGWFLDHWFSKKFQRMAREATDICLRVLKESNKSRFDSYSVRNKCIGHIPYYLSGLSRAQFLRQPFSK